MDFEGAISILRSDAGGAIFCMAFCIVLLRLFVLLVYFILMDGIEFAWSTVNANHCSDLHSGKSHGKCHCKRCMFNRECPYYENLTLRKRWQQFRAKRNKPY